jgi:peptidoglycan/LPS O-acetylase OafA/YrhL
MAPTAIPAWLGYYPGRDLWFALHWLPPLRLPEFCCGLVLGLVYIRSRPLPGAALLVPLALVALLLAPLAIHGPLWVLTNGGFDPLGMVLIYAAAWGRGAAVRLLSTRPAVLLGEASYGLYIIHYPLHQWLPALPFLPYAALAIAGAILLYRGVETPARRWIRRTYGAPHQTRPRARASVAIERSG